MAIINKGTAFSNGEQLSASKLNSLVDGATFGTDSVDNASTIVNANGAITVRDSGVTDAKLASGAVSTAKIAADAVTTAKILDANVTTAKIADANVTFAKLSTGAPQWDTSGKLKVGKDTGDGFPYTYITASREGTTDILDFFGHDSIKFRVTDPSGAEKVRIDDLGRVLLGVSTSPTTVSNSLVCAGRVVSAATYNITTSSSANVHVNSDGALARSTSSGRYKENIQDYDKGIEAIKSLRPVTYQSINEDDDSTYAGFIAEEVDEAGLTEFVDYNPEGQPDALHYANMNALLTKALQEAIARIEILEAK